MADEVLEPAPSGLDELPDVLDLRTVSEEDLEKRGMELRRRIARSRQAVKEALELRNDGPPIELARERLIQQAVEQLEVVQEALRGALEDVEREQERRSDLALRAREHSMLDSTRRSAVVQAVSSVAMVVCSVALAVITWWYASLTRDLLHAQIQPEHEVDLDRAKTELVIANPGPVPIVDVRVEVQQHTFIGGKRKGFGRAGAPACAPGPIDPGATYRCSLADAASQAVREGEMDYRTLASAKELQPGAILDPVVVARIRYRRAVDRKAFTTTLAFTALCCGPKGEASLFGGLGVSKDVDDAIRDLAFGSLSEPRRLSVESARTAAPNAQ